MDFTLPLAPTGITTALHAAFVLAVHPLQPPHPHHHHHYHHHAADSTSTLLLLPRDASGYPALPPLCLAPLHRAFEAFARALRPARFHAIHLLAQCLHALAACAAPPRVRAAVAPCLYALLDVAGGQRELQRRTRLSGDSRWWWVAHPRRVRALTRRLRVSLLSEDRTVTAPPAAAPPRLLTRRRAPRRASWGSRV